MCDICNNYTVAVENNNIKDIGQLDKNNWTIITKDKNTGNIIIKNSDNKKSVKDNNSKNNTKYLNKMINNWNAFRDHDIEILGDRSLYFNYKQELEEMIKEEESILEEMNNVYEVLSDDSYYSE